VVHGCFAKKAPHRLQVINTAVAHSCPAGTTGLNWSQTGPPGPSGVSNGYFAGNPYSVAMSGTGGWVEVVETHPLAAGHYLVNATLTAVPFPPADFY
jgi:hypothetical protein